MPILYQLGSKGAESCNVFVFSRNSSAVQQVVATLLVRDVWYYLDKSVVEGSELSEKPRHGGFAQNIRRCFQGEAALPVHSE